MRRVRVDELVPGMKVARTIHNSDGHILLHAGIELDQNYIRRLKAINIGSIYIYEPGLENVELAIPEVVSEQTRVQTVQAVKTSFENLEHHRKLNVRAVKTMVNKILDEVLGNLTVLFHLADIRSFDDYTFGHSVNVCILSIMTGITMHYNDIKLKELGIGALLHDIGKTRIDKSILNKPDDLTREEFAEVKKHTEYGFEILRQYDEISLLSAHIAYQHHERWDGNGYPRQLAGDEIHEYASIVAVADVYDALLADRPYRPSYTVNQAITIVNRMSGIYLNTDCVTALVANIAVYPIGSIVELNTGDIGIVVDVNKEMPTRPIIRIIYDRSSQRICRPHEIDLSTLTTIVIIRSLSQRELTELIGR